MLTYMLLFLITTLYLSAQFNAINDVVKSIGLNGAESSDSDLWKILIDMQVDGNR